MKTPEEIAEAIIRYAQDGYHRTDPGIGEESGYPPYALDPMTDRNRWTAYIRGCIVAVLNGEFERVRNRDR